MTIREMDLNDGELAEADDRDRLARLEARAQEQAREESWQADLTATIERIASRLSADFVSPMTRSFAVAR